MSDETPLDFNENDREFIEDLLSKNPQTQPNLPYGHQSSLTNGVEYEIEQAIPKIKGIATVNYPDKALGAIERAIYPEIHQDPYIMADISPFFTYCDWDQLYAKTKRVLDAISNSEIKHNPVNFDNYEPPTGITPSIYHFKTNRFRAPLTLYSFRNIPSYPKDLIMDTEYHIATARGKLLAYSIRETLVIGYSDQEVHTAINAVSAVPYRDLMRFHTNHSNVLDDDVDTSNLFFIQLSDTRSIAMFKNLSDLLFKLLQNKNNP